jgi:hypothetical protein
MPRIYASETSKAASAAHKAETQALRESKHEQEGYRKLIESNTDWRVQRQDGTAF